jgi:hypothetical protein
VSKPESGYGTKCNCDTWSVSIGVEIHLTKDTLDRVRIKNFVFILIYMLIGEVNLSNLADFFKKKNLRVGNVLCQGYFVNLDGSDRNFFLYMGRQCKSQQDDSKEIFEL